jgi:poly-gamma-glutamate synthesis protein (capsule biosynthesis protein)
MLLFLCGDVMLGRGIDQALPCSSKPALREPFVRDAREYIVLAEECNGPFSRPLGYADPWGTALQELAQIAPDVRIINLETSVTRSDAYWPGKEIHYRMHPGNLPCLTAAGIDVCALANNHVLDFGEAGLLETLKTLEKGGVRSAGAGHNLEEACAPARVLCGTKGAVLVFSFATESSGVPFRWAAQNDRPGVALLPDLSSDTAREVLGRVKAVKQPGSIVVASIHWGSNWGYEVPRSQVAFAHQLIDGGVDLIHGHSSHHPRPLEIYQGRLILYGCGDLLNDYEGICGYEVFRSELGLLYFAEVDLLTGALVMLRMRPTRMRHFRLERACPADAAWLRETLNRASEQFGVQLALKEDELGALRELYLRPGQGIPKTVRGR